MSTAPQTWAEYLTSTKQQLAARLSEIAEQRAALLSRIGFLEAEIIKTEATVFGMSDYDTIAARDREAKSATAVARGELAVKLRQLEATVVEYTFIVRVSDGNGNC